MHDVSAQLNRRAFMSSMSALGVGATALPAVLWARLQESEEARVTAEMISACEGVAGLAFTDAERELMLEGVNDALEGYERLREVEIPNSVSPAVRFEPVLPGRHFPPDSRLFRYSRPRGLKRPEYLEEVAFWPVTRLAELVRTRKVTSRELTDMYLDRLRRHGPTPADIIEGRSMASRGERRTCWPRIPTSRPGAPSRTSRRASSTMRPSFAGWRVRVRCSWRN
jgi:hypothetical protein